MNFLTIFAKISILNLWEGSKYVSGFKYVNSWIFVNITEFWICNRMQLWKSFEYVDFMQMQALYKVNNGWIMPYDRVLNMPTRCFTGI